jgi:hypothetical protein
MNEKEKWSVVICLEAPDDFESNARVSARC